MAHVIAEGRTCSGTIRPPDRRFLFLLTLEYSFNALASSINVEMAMSPDCLGVAVSQSVNVVSPGLQLCKAYIDLQEMAACIRHDDMSIYIARTAGQACRCQ